MEGKCNLMEQMDLTAHFKYRLVCTNFAHFYISYWDK
jgi:hypothetical protein